MNEADLRAVLLGKAIEEGDRAGTLLSAADRVAATRQAQRAGGEAGLLLGARARILLAKLTARHPFLDSVLALARGPAWGGRVLIACGFAVGVALSALDGTRRINILAFPLLALVVWNVAVYVLVLAGAARSLGTSHPPRRWLPKAVARLAMERMTRLVARAAPRWKTRV